MSASGPSDDHRRRWAYRRLYAAPVFELTTRLYPIVGRRVFHAVSRSVAFYYAATQPGVAAVVRENLSLLGAPPGDACVRRLFRNYATVISDYVAVGAMSRERARALGAGFSGREHIEQAIAAGKGAVLATGHFGFFEYGAVALGGLGLPMKVATLPEPAPELTRWRARWREKWGVGTVEVGADPFSAVGLSRMLAEGNLVAVLADRPQGGHGVAVPAPGGRTRFSITPAVLAMLSGAPIVPVTVALTADERYEVRAMPSIHVHRVPQASRQEALAEATLALADCLLPAFAAAPDQWFQFLPASCD